MTTLFVEHKKYRLLAYFGEYYPCFPTHVFVFPQFPDMYIGFMAGQLVSAAVESEMALSQLILKLKF